MNSVVTTRNLLDVAARDRCLKRFVNVSSFCVYSNINTKGGKLLDETCPVETRPERRGEAYCYGKVKQEELVTEYNRKYGIPCVTLRPGAVFGPGKKAITGRVGIGTFGIFLHLGGSNRIPFTYVDNCAEAIVLAGLKDGIDGEVMNIVDDQLPTSREFLRMYKKHVGHFKSIYVPKIASYFLCYLWEKYSERSKGQFAPVFNRNRWCSDWKGNRYSNMKLKAQLGWEPKVSFSEAAKLYFEYCKGMDKRNA
jgi:nucleoside-diphosphate-sugar epimerase